MKKLLVVTVLAGLGVGYALIDRDADAQAPTGLFLHGHPQIAQYASPDAYPTFSYQGHWAPGENPIAAENGQPIVLDITAGTLGTSTLAHTHVDFVKCPTYAELSGPVTCGFAVKLFHTTGQLYLTNTDGLRDIIWDATGSEAVPVLRCETMLCVWTGHFTIDPTLPQVPNNRWYTPHGWWSPFFGFNTVYDNGDTLSVRAINPFWSNVDPNAPIVDTGLGPLFSVRANPHSLRHPNDAWGDNLVETSGYLPVAPIDAPYTNFLITAGYGGQLSGATFEQRSDLDLHNHVGGQILKFVQQDGDINTSVTYDPALLGAGVHKMALMRNQLSNEGNDAVNTLITFDVTVGPAFPAPPDVCPNIAGLQVLVPIGMVLINGQCVIPPVTCDPGFHLENGVCVPDAPIEVWQTGGLLQQLFINAVGQNRYRVCSLAGCKEIQ